MSLRKQYEDWLEEFCHLDNPPEFIPKTVGIEWEVEEDIMKSLMKKKKKLSLKLGMGTKLALNQKLYNEVNMLQEKTQDFFLITINPKEEFWTGDKFNYFFNLCCKFTTYKWSKEFYLFFEQRGEIEEKMGYGTHAHIVLTKHKTERKRLIDNMTSCFGAVCGEPFVNTINVKNKKFEWLSETLNEYLIDQKKEDDKLDKCKIDAIWREKNNIQQKYYWNCDDVGLTIDKRPTSFKSASGGARKGSGVKKGTIRGKYKKKEKTETGTTELKIPTPDKIVNVTNENIILEF